MLSDAVGISCIKDAAADTATPRSRPVSLTLVSGTRRHGNVPTASSILTENSESKVGFAGEDSRFLGNHEEVEKLFVQLFEPSTSMFLRPRLGDWVE